MKSLCMYSGHHCPETARKNNIIKTALLIIGDVVAHNGYDRSKLYDRGFTTEFRKGTDSI